jgi:hypothetical protein
MLLRSYLEDKFKKSQDVLDKVDQALIPSMVGLGSLFYVDATNGDDTFDGKSWKKAKATIDAAIGLCTADKGDRILMAPWHAETLTAATSCVMDIAGVSLLGIVQGNQRPTISLGTLAAATISVTAANCRISGIKLISAVIDATAGITVAATGDGLEVDNCIITDGGAALEMVIGISLAAAADGCYIHDNRFYTVPAGGCATAITLVGESAQTVIVRNYIQGDYSASAISGVTAAATLLTVSDNYIINIDTTAGSCIDMHASTTGMSCNNRMMGGKSIADCWIADGMVSIENYATGAVSASGLVEPAVDGD